MKILSVDDAAVRLGAEIIAGGGIVAFPTETVYGLGADAMNAAALARIFEVKGRPRFDPLIIHIAALDNLEKIADLRLLEPEARRQLEVLTRRLWPGPLTVVLPKQRWIPGLATGGLPTAAIRFPAHPAAQELIRLSTGAVAAPSANLFGCLSPTRAEHVLSQLGEKVDLILNGGRTLVGVESTVLDLSSGAPRILRPGGVSRERIEALIGPVLAGTAGGEDEAPRAPGSLKSHYAPRTPLSVYTLEDMVTLAYDSREGYLFFDAPSQDAWLAGQQERFPSILLETGPKPPIRVLSGRGNLREAAANLFDMLHELDGLGLARIRVEQAPSVGLGQAVNDRLFKARNASEEARPMIQDAARHGTELVLAAKKNAPSPAAGGEPGIIAGPGQRTLIASEDRYLALLRGINVGGNNSIKMDQLKQTFEEMKFTGIITYIQSGNIIFSGKEKNRPKLIKKIETRLSREYHYDSRIVLLTFAELKKIVHEAPAGFGEDKETYRYDVWFLREPLTGEEALKSISAREGVDRVYQGKRVVYTSRLISLAGKSWLTKIIQQPVYQNISIRNWNTTQKLYELMGK